MDYDIETNVGINEIDLEESVDVYPVPSNGAVSIDVNIPANLNIKAKVVNLFGEEVMNLGEISNGTTSVDLSGNAAGVYFIQLSAGQNNVIKKIILI